MRTLRFCLACIGSMALIIGCGGDQGGPTEPPPQPVAGIAVLSGANATDTISTTLTQLLTVEVRGATGAPVAGANVRFTTGSFVSGYGMVHNLSLVADPTAPPNARYFIPVYTRGSDADGRVSVLVQLGTTAGNAPIVVDVPALGYVDTVQMKVTPGAATRISIVDTGVVVGSTVQLRASVTDRAGNPRNDQVSFSAASSASGTASVSSNGVVTGGAFARQR